VCVRVRVRVCVRVRVRERAEGERTHARARERAQENERKRERDRARDSYLEQDSYYEIERARAYVHKLTEGESSSLVREKRGREEVKAPHRAVVGY